jgi:hypothetical protein
MASPGEAPRLRLATLADKAELAQLIARSAIE